MQLHLIVIFKCICHVTFHMLIKMFLCKYQFFHFFNCLDLLNHKMALSALKKEANFPLASYVLLIS